MNRQNPALGSLLQTDDSDILLIQEPWFNRISTLRSDSDPNGSPVYGPILNDRWHCFLPEHDPTDASDICLVATYVRTSLTGLPTDTFSALPRFSHPWASRSCLILDIDVGGDLLRLVNVYNQVADNGRRHGLTTLSPPPEDHISTAIAGDFNTHSPLWSLPSATISSWHGAVEEWMTTHDLQLISEPQVVTWRGVRGPHNTPVQSVLDIVLLNLPGVISDQFSPVSVSFESSLGSDHAAVFWHWTPLCAIPALPPRLLPGFKLDDTQRDAWVALFKALPSPSITDQASTTLAASSLLDDINGTCASLFPRRQTADPRGARWWNADCSAALSLAKLTALTISRRAANTGLRVTVREAKRAWAQHYLNSASPDQLWAATRWRKGRRVSTIPPLRATSELDPSADPAAQAEILRERFFSSAPRPVLVEQPDDPAPLPTRSFTPISKDEIHTALSSTSNSSAPGISGINYKLLKWAFSAVPDRFVTLYNACITNGIHPWTDAKVIPVPKPQRPDYSLPKAYRPISLLECCGKLLEKLIATRVMDDASRFGIVPMTQFGSRKDHCAEDAALAVAHTAQSCLRSKYVCSLLLFDIQGFFDNINVDRLVYLFQLFGFDPSLGQWLRSFLMDRHLHFDFNNTSSAPFSVNHGTPQGSPISPILSAIFTAPMLHFLNRTWTGRSLFIYVDDGAIVASGLTHRLAAGLVAEGFEHVTNWLERNGLRIDPDKTEFISFFHPRWSTLTHGSPVAHLALRTPYLHFSVPSSKVVRYLGVFFDQRLSWSHHVKVTSCRARSTVHALGVLGNSIRGLSFASWRKVFHAIVIPVLLYGASLWYTGRQQKSLTDPLQVAQNDAIRKMSGVFKTTPTAPLHCLLNILPIPLTLQRSSSSFSLRLSRLPPNTILRTITTTNTAAPWSIRFPVPTTLHSLLPSSFPPYITPSPPHLPTWSHPRLADHLNNPNNNNIGNYVHCIGSHPSPESLSLFIYPLPVPDHPHASFLLYHGEQLVASRQRSDSRLQGALFGALNDSVEACSTQPPLPLFIFVPFQLARLPLFRLCKHSFLSFSSTLTSSLDKLFSNHNQRVTLFRSATKRPKSGTCRA